VPGTTYVSLDCRGRSSPVLLDPLFPPREVRIPSKHSFWTQIGLGVGAAAALVVAVQLSHPFYVSQEPVASAIIEHKYVDSTELRAPWLHATAEVALQTPQFLLDRELFAMDLLRTGKVNQTRARSLADVAVREAYTRKIPPALVLGVMLTENDELKSSARSHVGAVGLMQVSPRPWRGLGRKFGTNVRTDSTNLKYGVFILGWVTGKATDLVDNRDDAWRKALLRYNGCVHGRNTRDCKSYPDAVRRQVQASALATCRGADFDHCVVAPMWLARRDAEDTTTTQQP
jgi:soluble lytic murein transglycosylase-like protein